MHMSFSLACFSLMGSASMDTAGGLKHFLVQANNPMCFLEGLIEAIAEGVPGGGAILDLIDISIARCAHILEPTP